MPGQLQTDGTLPVALRGDAELTACADWGGAGETVHQAEPGRGHAGWWGEARWTHIIRTQSQVKETIWTCVEWFSGWCKNYACNWFIGTLNITQCQCHHLRNLIISTIHVKHAHVNCVEALMESINTPPWESKVFISAPHVSDNGLTFHFFCDFIRDTAVAWSLAQQPEIHPNRSPVHRRADVSF